MLKLNTNYLTNLRGIKQSYSFLRKNGFSNHKIRLFHSGNTSSIKLNDLEHLCKILKCTPNDILDWQPDKENKTPENHPLHKLTKKESINLSKITNDMNPEKLVEFSEKVLEIKNLLNSG